jgi:S-adenosylmethionine decarboxylase
VSALAVEAGREWVVEGYGCSPAALADRGALEGLFDAMIAELGLRPVAAPVWHRFPGPGGLTGFVVLAESHLACHTFPEHGTICLNLFCCRPRPDWPFEAELARRLGAGRVAVRVLERPHALAADAGVAAAPAAANTGAAA